MIFESTLHQGKLEQRIENYHQDISKRDAQFNQ
jgi:hypothetical protein